MKTSKTAALTIFDSLVYDSNPKSEKELNLGSITFKKIKAKLDKGSKSKIDLETIINIYEEINTNIKDSYPINLGPKVWPFFSHLHMTSKEINAKRISFVKWFLSFLVSENKASNISTNKELVRIFQ